MGAADYQLVAIGCGVLTLVVLFWTWRTRRHLVRRIASVVSRLESIGTVDVVGSGRLEASLAKLERAAGSAALAVSDAHVAAERLGDAFRFVDSGVVVCDDNGDVVFRNERADELVGDLLGETLARDTVDKLLGQSLVEGHPLRETLDLFGPPRRTLEMTASALVNASKLIGAVVVVEDVAERRRLEAVRRDFVANVADELRTPVAALTALAEALGEEDDTAVVQRLGARIERKAARVGRVVDDLLTLGRIEAEESPRREPVALHLVLAQAIEGLDALARDRKVEVVLHEPGRRVAVLGDRQQLVTAVECLAQNAVLYSEPGSQVTIDSRTNGTDVEVVVSDHGIGIPSRDLQRVFERFYRVDRARSHHAGGSGLGLAIVRHVAGNHHGEVRVQSEEGKGSTFTLRLPAVPGPVAFTADAEAG
ncbi:MAG: two-component system, OmpR family, sensor histidine kinase SenX3 [Actinomycetota bacterium]|jgi:two-component system sensor histidine kinase SenX3|nr:two-component system, OmpR family, sensor histidine kinase SenX3 [Actinomycetota bacterium]